MDGLVLIVIGIIAILVVLGIILLMIVLKKKEDRIYEEPDYKVFFIMGINFIPIGLVFVVVVSPAFFWIIAIGFCYIAISLANKDKWKKKQ